MILFTKYFINSMQSLVAASSCERSSKSFVHDCSEFLEAGSDLLSPAWIPPW